MHVHVLSVGLGGSLGWRGRWRSGTVSACCIVGFVLVRIQYLGCLLAWMSGLGFAGVDYNQVGHFFSTVASLIHVGCNTSNGGMGVTATILAAEDSRGNTSGRSMTT